MSCTYSRNREYPSTNSRKGDVLNILKDAGITYTNARNRNSTKKGMGRRRCLNNIEEKGMI